jgi:hypothetical protein
MKLIKVKNQWVPLALEPKELEPNIRFNNLENNTEFQNNAMQTIKKLCTTYKIRYHLGKQKSSGYYKLRLRFVDIDIRITALGPTYRKAMRSLLFKLHREYLKKIKVFSKN